MLAARRAAGPAGVWADGRAARLVGVGAGRRSAPGASQRASSVAPSNASSAALDRQLDGRPGTGCLDRRSGLGEADLAGAGTLSGQARLTAVPLRMLARHRSNIAGQPATPRRTARVARPARTWRDHCGYFESHRPDRARPADFRGCLFCAARRVVGCGRPHARDNPLRQLLGELCRHLAFTLAAGAVAIPIEPIPGLDALMTPWCLVCCTTG